MKKSRAGHRTPALAGFDDELVNLGELQTAVLNVAVVRFHAFLVRFGREPHPEEPLFFDVSRDQPVWAAPGEIRQQIIEAAQLTEADYKLMLRFFGLDKLGPIFH